MVARRRGDDTLGFGCLVQLQQAVERAALLISSGELEIFEFQIDVAAEHLRERLADQRRRLDDRAGNAGARGEDVIDGDGQRRGALDLGKRVHMVAP